MITKQPLLTHGCLRVVKILHGKQAGQTGTVERYFTDARGEDRAQVAIPVPYTGNALGNMEQRYQVGHMFANVRLVHLDDALSSNEQAFSGESPHLTRTLTCACGADLGRVTLRTRGLCAACGRSKWIQLAAAVTPKSQAIAVSLTRRLASTCVHGRSPCISRCGVERVHDVSWAPVLPERRAEWIARMLQRREEPVT